MPSPMPDGPAAHLAACLYAAHAGGTRLHAVPDAALVTSTDQGYDVQQRVADRLGGRLGRLAGWKVGRKSPDGVASRAPLFEDRLHRSGCVLGRDLPERPRPYTRTDILDAISAVVVAFEIIDSRFSAWPALPPALLLADFLSHGAMVMGTEIPLPHPAAFAEIPVRLTIDGRTVAEHRGGNPAGDIVELVAWLANDRAAAGRGLRAGDLVTTGSCTGMQLLPPGCRAEACFAGIGAVTVTRRAT